MPTNKDVKRLVRKRMQETGLRYTEARAAMGLRSPAEPRPTAEARWIELLGDPRQNEAAFRLLRELPADRLRPLAIAGTQHADAKVRRRSCQLLDDLPLTDPSIAALDACASDPHPAVRAAALHTLSCERCKPDGRCLDQRTIAERAAGDRSARVRRGVALGLSWNPRLSDDWAITLATRFLTDPSAEIRAAAEAALARIDLQRRSDEERRQLPDELRRKTERHVGKWVAIADGRIVAVDPTPSWRRRHPEVPRYFVADGADVKPA